MVLQAILALVSAPVSNLFFQMMIYTRYAHYMYVLRRTLALQKCCGALICSTRPFCMSGVDTSCDTLDIVVRQLGQQIRETVIIHNWFIGAVAENQGVPQSK